MGNFIKGLGIGICLAFLSFGARAQKQLPSTQVATLNGKSLDVRSLQEEGKPMIISFWATWCKPCITELDAINEAIIDLGGELDFQMVAISIDDARSLSRLRPMVNGRAWEFEVYSDANSNLKRDMGVTAIPHTFILDAQGNIVWQHRSYNPGDEQEYLKVLRNLP